MMLCLFPVSTAGVAGPTVVSHQLFSLIRDRGRQGGTPIPHREHRTVSLENRIHLGTVQKIGAKYFRRIRNTTAAGTTLAQADNRVKVVQAWRTAVRNAWACFPVRGDCDISHGYEIRRPARSHQPFRRPPRAIGRTEDQGCRTSSPEGSACRTSAPGSWIRPSDSALDR